MKLAAVIFLLFRLPVFLFSQTIYGIVLDSETRDTISFASVYFSGTFVGTHTDENGRFSMELSGSKFMPLTISAIGYYSVTLTEFPKQTFLKIYLNPKVYQMNGVVVSAESLLRERENNMRMFKREFLGSSIYASKCEILNEKDITFNYGNDADTLKAFASNLIRIHNPLLGYNIACFLDEFSFCRKTSDLNFTGFFLFEHDLIDSSKMNKILKRRRHAYLGSPMHFFRSLWANELKKDKYNAYSDYNLIKGNRLYKKVVIETDSIKFFHFPNDLCLSYSGKKTNIEFLGDSVAFNDKGQYDFTKLKWIGDMARFRIGDWLPMEYEP